MEAPFPENLKAGACPEGTEESFWTIFTYDCDNTTKFAFDGCLAGYEKKWDFSQNLTDPNNPGFVTNKYSVRCELPGKEASEYEDRKIPCGNSGAQMIVVDGGFYVCAYTE